MKMNVFDLISQCIHAIHLAKLAGKNKVSQLVDKKYINELNTLFSGQNYRVNFIYRSNLVYMEVEWISQ